MCVRVCGETNRIARKMNADTCTPAHNTYRVGGHDAEKLVELALFEEKVVEAEQKRRAV